MLKYHALKTNFKITDREQHFWHNLSTFNYINDTMTALPYLSDAIKQRLIWQSLVILSVSLYASTVAFSNIGFY